MPNSLKTKKIVTTLKPLKKYIAKYKKFLAFGLLFLIFGNLLQICEPIVIGSGFNVLKKDFLQPNFLLRAFEYLTIDTKYKMLIFFVFLFFLINLIRLPFVYFHRLLIKSAANKIECDLRDDLFSHLQSLPLFYHHRQKTGDLMARLGDDIKCVDDFAQAGIALGNYLILAPISVIYLYMIGRELVIYSLIPLIGVSISTYIYSKYVLKNMRIVQKHFGLLSTRVQENLTGIRIVKSYGNEQTEIDNYQRINRENFKKNMALHRIWSLAKSSVFFLIGLSQLIFLGIGCGMIISGKITSGNFAAFFYQLSRLSSPIALLGMSFGLFQRGLARMERINEMLLQKPDIKASKKIDKNITAIEGEIELKNLTFSLEKDKAILQNITIKLEKNKSVGIIGNIGSGKSTLLNLIAGLYVGPKGTIFIDRNPIEKIPLNVLRSSIGYVSQEPFLFSGSVRENICFGSPGATQETLDRVSIIADIKKDIDGFPQQYDTLVGERGVSLSGGQKQRIAIAQAIIIKPEILLLDNALSQLDADTEKKILKNLAEQMEGCTVIFVSNRIGSIKHADLIAVLIKGQIVEAGTHDELLQMQGFYSKFFERELIEEMLETV